MHIFVRSRIGKLWDPTKSGDRHPWPGGAQKRRLKQGDVHDFGMHQALDIVQERLPLRAVPLPGLLVEQRIDIGVAAISVAPTRDRKRLDTRGGIPRGPNGQLIYRPDDVIWSTGEYPDPKAFPTPTWETLQQLREASPRLPVIVKGVMTSEDTALAVQHGMSGVIVSNHGARQLDQVGATIEALPECVEAAGGRMPVLVDGGFRRGTDIVKALALGATAVGIARPYLWGLASFGPRGVSRVMELLRAELATDMGMVGVGKVSQLDRSFVRIRR